MLHQNAYEPETFSICFAELLTMMWKESFICKSLSSEDFTPAANCGEKFKD